MNPGIFRFLDPEFDYSTKEARLNYHVLIPDKNIDQKITEVVRFNFDFIDGFDQSVINNLLRLLSFVAGVSYYKAWLPDTIEGSFDDEEKSFIKKLWLNGLGQYFYENSIKPQLGEFVKIESKLNKKNIIHLKSRDKFLVPFGGGKDSLVTLELLKQGGCEDLETITIGQYGFIEQLLPEYNKHHNQVDRVIDGRLITWNEQGAFNGHIPISSVWALISCIAAELRSCGYVVLSNEASASIENLTWNELKINHQYSKSLEFEQDLQYILFNSVGKRVQYFSLLRNLDEYQIFDKFISLGLHSKPFISCNRNFVQNNSEKSHKWCAKCEKCVFVALMLAAWLDQGKIAGIFGSDVIASTIREGEQREHALALVGKGKHKPLECVGAEEEVAYAVQQAVKGGGYDELVFLLNPDKSAEYDLSKQWPDSVPSEYDHLLQ